MAQARQLVDDFHAIEPSDGLHGALRPNANFFTGLICFYLPSDRAHAKTRVPE
jgi:hypothetical protein